MLGPKKAAETKTVGPTLPSPSLQSPSLAFAGLLLTPGPDPGELNGWLASVQGDCLTLQWWCGQCITKPGLRAEVSLRHQGSLSALRLPCVLGWTAADISGAATSGLPPLLL